MRPGLGALVGRKTIGLRPGYRRQGMAVASRRERCRDRADIVDIVHGAAGLARELLAGIDGHHPRGVKDSTAPALIGDAAESRAGTASQTLSPISAAGNLTTRDSTVGAKTGNG